VSDDNAFVEVLFRTAKDRPSYSSVPFASLGDARRWVEHFVYWYNEDHQHSGIRFVTPSQRHAGLDVDILGQRHYLYEEAKSRDPERWSGSTRDWTPIETVRLNGRPRSDGKNTPTKVM